MSNFAALGVMVALWIANAFLSIRLDKWINDFTETITTGVVRGVQVPVEYRRHMLRAPLIANVAAHVAIHSGLTLGWILIGRNTGVEELKLLAYLFAFINGVATFSWPLVFPFHYRHLAAILRQAEAD